MSDKLATISIPMWALIITVVFGTMAGTWALSGEVHGSRQRSTVLRIDSIDTAVSGLLEADTESKIERTENRLGIEQINFLLEEIRADVKTLIGAK
jgi:hypothetical protein